MATIFSKIISGDIPSYKIVEDDKFFAFLDINPLTKGHTLVVPKVEIDYIFDIEDDLLTEMVLFAKKVALGIKQSIDCNRVAMMVLGLEVPHAHIHLVPINNEGDLNLSNPRVKLTETEFKEIAKLISENITL